MKRSPLTITIAFLLIVVFGLMLFVFQVRKSEVAVVTRFGKLVQDRVITNAGPYLQWPWPIEQVYHLDQRVHCLEDRLEPLTLPDQNTVQLLTYVGWRIDDPFKFFSIFRDGSMTAAEGTLENIIRSAKLEVAGRHTFSDFLSADPALMKLPQIEDEILASAREKVRAVNYGIEIKFVQIKTIELPASDTGSVFDRMKSERSKLVAAITADAQEQANKITSKADSDAAKLLADADARSKEIRGEGEAEMVKALQVLRGNPALAKFIMDLDMLEELSKDKTTWVLDHTTPGLELLQSPKTPEGGDEGLLHPPK
jgi:membrane protease subunit HflC